MYSPFILELWEDFSHPAFPCASCFLGCTEEFETQKGGAFCAAGGAAAGPVIGQAAGHNTKAHRNHPIHNELHDQVFMFKEEMNVQKVGNSNVGSVVDYTNDGKRCAEAWSTHGPVMLWQWNL